MKVTAFAKYMNALRDKLKRGDATEHTHRPAFQNLLEELHPDIEVTNEPKQISCGAPDFVIRKSVSQAKTETSIDNGKDKTLFGNITRTRRKPKTRKLVQTDENKVMLIAGYIEAKDIGVSLDNAQKSDQLIRYKKNLPNLILTNYIEFRWFQNGELKRSEKLGTYNEKKQAIQYKLDDASKVHKLIEDFLGVEVKQIVSSEELATQLAQRTHIIRDIIVKSFNVNETSKTITDLRKAFSEVLIPDILKDEKTGEFADMFAQTLTYGLFAARVNHKNKEPFDRRKATEEIPKTNPFLRNLFSIITGSAFIYEPYYPFVDEIVQLLAHTNIEEILKDFGKATRQEDPMIHFYETFLSVYDPELKKVRGVYYTPEPVVSYIVRSVDHILKEKFGLIDGLADETTIEDNKTPKVLILDPACGTGTFLYEVIRTIRDKFKAENNAGKWKGFVKERLLNRIFGFELLMSPYAVAHFKLALLLTAQDLPEDQRANWSYEFDEKSKSEDDRIKVYLTNTLEEIEEKGKSFYGDWDIIPSEATAANKVKSELPIMVVLGNPPYSGHSYNRSEKTIEIQTKKGNYVRRKVKTFIGNLIQDYFSVDGKTFKELGEKNTKWLNNDYVKFIRWNQWRINNTGSGIHAMITDHSYLDASTFRGMRQQLMNTYDEIYILNLHGNSLRREISPDNKKDENVFDIQEGVAIGIFVKYPQTGNSDKKESKVMYEDVFGLREVKSENELVDGKFHYLIENDIDKTNWKVIHPTSPNYYFYPFQGSLKDEFENYKLLSEVCISNSVGLVTAWDSLTINYSKQDLWKEIGRFLKMTSEEAIKNYPRKKTPSEERITRSKLDLMSTNINFSEINQLIPSLKETKRTPPFEELVKSITYRPFDNRYTYYTGNSNGFHERPRTEIQKHAILFRNLTLLTNKNTKIKFKHTFVSRNITDLHLLETANASLYCFPLYINSTTEASSSLNLMNEQLYWEEDEEEKIPNLNPDFVNEFAEKLGLQFISSGESDLVKTFNPEDIFHYIYAVFHSPTYRERYAEFLRIDFPRVPMTSDKDLFAKLVQFGADLVSLHLLEHDYKYSTYTKNKQHSPIHPSLARKAIPFPVAGDNYVDKQFPKYLEVKDDNYIEKGAKSETKFGVFINKNQYFANVSQIAWEFEIGGYKPAQKWLKERQKHNRQLSDADLTHYSQMIIALEHTHSLMLQIDKILSFPVK